MNLLKTSLYNCLILLSANTLFAQQSDLSIQNPNLQRPTISQNTITYASPKENIEKVNPYEMLTLTDSTKAPVNTITYPPATRDYTRLGYDTAMYLGVAVISFGILYAMPESVTNWDKQDMKENGIFHKWKENVKAGPVWDEDDWVLNWITHPYSGGVYYMTARSSGFNIFESFLYTTIMSTCFWEYGIEAFAEIPSKQDLIITPIIGSLIGEGFFYAKKSIFKSDKKVLNSRFLGYTCLTLMDPFNTLLDSFGYQQKIKTHLGVAPVGFDSQANKAIWGVNFNMQF